MHAGGDATGAEIERALVAAVERSDIEVREGWFAIELLVERGRCTGVIALRPDGEVEFVRAVDVVLATGGVGQCFAVTTNPTLSTGDGVALALKAGVACADLEFVQFHPTALHHPSMPRPLLSEALRGEGAVLRDLDGVAFMAGVHPLADLAPRDVVARALHQKMAATERRAPVARRDDDRRLPAALPDDLGGVPAPPGSIPTRDWLPVAPAAHYLSGGVVTDLDGASTLPHLWACGETACSGVHGANRLGVELAARRSRVRPARRARDRRGKDGAESTGAMAGVLSLAPPELEVSDRSGRAAQGAGDRARGAARRGAAHDDAPTAASCATPRACSSRPTRWPTSPRSPKISRRARSRPTR